jgi:hypothetical protein
MTQEPSERERKERVNKALDAHVFKVRGVSPRSKWARKYSKMMREPLSQEEWSAHQEKLKDPGYAAEWLDRVLSGRHPRSTSPDSKRRSRK